MKQITKIMTLLFLLTISTGITPTRCHSAEQIDTKIQQMIELSAGTSVSKMAESLDELGLNYIATLKEANPNISSDIIAKSGKKFYELLKKEFLSNGGLLQQMSSVYKKYYSEKDIDKFIEFYKSDIYQKMFKNNNSLTDIDANKLEIELEKIIETTGGTKKQLLIAQEVEIKFDQSVKRYIEVATNGLNDYLKSLGYKLNGDKLVRL